MNKSVVLKEKILKLDTLSPLKVLARGYSVAETNGKVLTDASKVSLGDEVNLTLNKGKLKCSIISKEEK